MQSYPNLCPKLKQIGREPQLAQSEMALWVPASKPENLRSVLRIHVVEGENKSQTLTSDLSCICHQCKPHTYMHTCTQTGTHTYAHRHTHMNKTYITSSHTHAHTHDLTHISPLHMSHTHTHKYFFLKKKRDTKAWTLISLKSELRLNPWPVE